MYVGSRLKRAWKSGRRHLKSLPSSRTGENPPYGMIGGVEETSASFEARSAPRSYPTVLNLHWSFAALFMRKTDGVDNETGSSDLPVGRFVDGGVKLFFGFSEKYFRSHAPQITSRTLASHPTGGAYHDRHGRGVECGGRGSVLRATGLQGGLKDL